MSSGSERPLKVALIGNPNCGKTSLFNQLTGLNQKVGNFSGVTVERKNGSFELPDGRPAELTDLPGTYSLYPKSGDERVVTSYLINQWHEDYPDVLVMVVDETSLKRNLLLFSQISELGIPFVVAFNMVEAADKAGIKVQIDQFRKVLGVHPIEINARTGKGLEDLKKALLSPQENVTWEFFTPDQAVKQAIDQAKEILPARTDYMAMQYLFQAKLLDDSITESQRNQLRDLALALPAAKSHIQLEEVIHRYTSIDELIPRIVPIQLEDDKQLALTQKLDKLVVHPIFGYVTFLAILVVIFQVVFSVASYPMDWIDQGMSSLNGYLQKNMPAGLLTDLLTDGILAGIGGILIFIPQIALLFLMIGLLEESGYMARVMFLMDKLMRPFGLNGRSVVPLVSAAACAVPAIMSARAIENWKDRIITIFVTPLISCSARLPVYAILIGIIVPDIYVLGFISVKALVLLAMYLLGAVMAVLSALVMKWIIKARERSFFIMELPAYRAPRVKNISLIVYDKTKSFVIEAGKIILAISVVLWVLSSYGPDKKMQEAETRALAESATLSEEGQQALVDEYKLEASYAGHFGKLIEPAIEPLGYDWKLGVALITSFAAREVFVGTISTMYSIGSDEEATIQEKLKSEINSKTGEPVFNLPTALSLLIFYAFAMQCMSTLATTKKETGSWKWPMLQLFYMTGLAYLSALLTYHIAS